MPVIPATQEAEASRFVSFKPAQAKVVKPYLKNKIQTKMWEHVLSDRPLT
jgi:cytochrome b